MNKWAMPYCGFFFSKSLSMSIQFSSVGRMKYIAAVLGNGSRGSRKFTMAGGKGDGDGDSDGDGDQW